jgi:hypothetical protein
MAKINPSGLETCILFAMENPTNAMKQMTMKRLMNVWVRKGSFGKNISVVLSDGMRLGKNVMHRIFISIEIHKKTRTFLVQVLLH